MTIEDVREIARDKTEHRDARQRGDSRARDMMAELMLR